MSLPRPARAPLGRARESSSVTAARESARLRVKDAPTRCPYCHAGVSGEQPTVVCGQCLSRHHEACWLESCASCRSAQRMVVDPALVASARGARLRSSLSSGARRVLPHVLFAGTGIAWLVTLPALLGALWAAFGLPQATLTHGVAALRAGFLGEDWSSHPPYWFHGEACPTSAWAGALLLLLLPVVLGLSSAAALAHARGSARRLVLAVMGLVGACLVLPAWALVSGTPFDPDTVGFHRETLGWLLALFSLPAALLALVAPAARRSTPPPANGAPPAAGAWSCRKGEDEA